MQAKFPANEFGRDAYTKDRKVALCRRLRRHLNFALKSNGSITGLANSGLFPCEIKYQMKVVVTMC